MLAPFTLLNNGEGEMWTRGVPQDINALPTILESYHLHSKQLSALVPLCLKAFSKAEKGHSAQVLKVGHSEELILLFLSEEAFNLSSFCTCMT